MALADILKNNLDWNKARIDLLANMIIALIKVRTVCLTEIATALSGKAKKDSKYKRLQRFFRFFPMDIESVSRVIASMLPIFKEKWTLSIDRTNWKLGKANINILVLGICYRGVCFPIIWISLDKRGNSNTRERITVIDKFIRLFGKEKIRCLTADREFIGVDWFKYLLNESVHFRIRIKENFQVTSSKGNKVDIKVLFRNLKPGQTRILSRPRKICGVKVFIIGHKLQTGKYLILVTDSCPESAMEDYKLRWDIETLFACLKTRGFNFEATHITDLDRINKLVAVLAVTFCWCHITGEWLHQQKSIKIKKHGRPAVSIFRYGLDFLREIVLNLSDNRRKFNQIIRILSRKLDLNHADVGAG
mgnify:FL=1|jgi:hypothetical protein